MNEIVNEQRIFKKHFATRIATQRMKMMNKNDLLMKKKLTNIMISNEKNRRRSN